MIDACGTSSLENAEVIRVVSNKKDAYGLTRAQNAHIPTTYHNLVAGGYKKSYPDDVKQAREKYDQDLADLISQNNPKPDLVVCAGWMHILSPGFIDALTATNISIINLHPALFGTFDGANAIARAWEAYQKGDVAVTGVMIHYVISEVDRGEPIIMEEVKISDCQTESELEEKIHKVEHRLIVDGTAKALQRVRSVKSTT